MWAGPVAGTVAVVALRRAASARTWQDQEARTTRPGVDLRSVLYGQLMVTPAGLKPSDLATWSKHYVAQHNVADEVAALITAAVAGEEALDAALSGDRVTTPTGDANTRPTESGAYLRRLEVSGFRGIGPAAFIGFQPMPGLTVISGRNGSGKSSFSEAMEVALTGSAHRWHKANTQFEPEHRNLHSPTPCQIRLDLLQEGTDPSRIEVTWEPGAPRGTFRRTLQRANQLPEDGIDSLGWEQALVTYRPLLSYEELGELLSGRQIDIANAVQRALGLSELTAAKQLINARASAAGVPRDREKEVRLTLRSALEQATAEGADDPRIVEALNNFATKSVRRSVDLPRARELAVGGGDSPTKPLDGVLQLELPEPQAVQATIAELRDALAAVDENTAETDRFAELHRQLLHQALNLHAHAGDVACPVCGEGTLDGAWRTRVEASLAASGEAARRRDEAAGRLRRAEQGIRTIVRPLPPAALQTAFDLAAQQAAVEASLRWATLPAEVRSWPHHVETTYATLVAATSAWQEEAHRVAQERQDVWAPLAIHLSEWVSAYETYQANLPTEDRLKQAKKVMAELEKAAQTERMAPITEQAQHVWNQLKQESNVDVSDIAISPRKLEITAEVDGKPTGALRVMSQGELHALALALFLPRVTMADSPFRFVVLDDPVQAMDPAKVEGLLTVLLEIAQTHQVIVLSHDDRLADAARRRDSADGIRILEVQRAENSVVTVQPVLDPVERHINDAWTLFNDDRMPVAAKAFVIPGVLRMALESAAHERFFTRELRSHRRLQDLEREWDEARSTVKRVRLAVAPDEVHVWAYSAQRRAAIDAAGVKNHTGIPPDQLEASIKAVMWTARNLRDGE